MTNDSNNEKVTSPVFNSTLFKSAFKIGGIYVQRGFNTFSGWSKKMEESCGEQIKPWLSSVWEMLKNIPEGMKFDEIKMSAMFEFIGSMVQDGSVKTYADVIFSLSKRFSEESLIKFTPFINIAYIGIKKFFEENQIPRTESQEERTPTMSRTAKTNTKSSKKKTSDKKVDAREESADTPSPVKVTYYKRMGIVELSNNNAVSIALLRNALDQKFIAIERVYKAKDGEYKVKNKLWLPFKEMGDIGDVIAHAYNEGVKAGWLNTYEPQPMILPQENVPTKSQEKPALRELVLVSKDASLYQTTLFDDEEKK